MLYVKKAKQESDIPINLVKEIKKLNVKRAVR